MKKEEIIGKEYKCLDHGFVRLIDVMGGDDAIVQAARVSYGKGTKSVSQDRGLIRYLMRQRHTSPFEMAEFKFHVKLPIFVARQWIRHRTASVNEYSGRYSEMRNEFYLPELEQIRTQNSQNKQGRSEEAISGDNAESIAGKMKEIQSFLYEEYEALLKKDIARELARINLPLSTYTEWYWKIDLHNLFHFLKLRLDRHAQYEIRVYSEVIAEIIKHYVPAAYEAFEDYILNSISFSHPEQKALSFIYKENLKPEEAASKAGLTDRETGEFINKIGNFI